MHNVQAVLPLIYLYLILPPLFFAISYVSLHTCTILRNFHNEKIVFNARAFATFILLKRAVTAIFVRCISNFCHADSCSNYIYCDMHEVCKCVKSHLAEGNCNILYIIVTQSVPSKSNYVQISHEIWSTEFITFSVREMCRHAYVHWSLSEHVDRL